MREQEAIDRLKQGDIRGLETLVRRYQLQAVRAADLISRDRTLAEDIVQDALLKVYQRIAQFDAGRPFGPWFLRIVVNDTLKAISKNDRWLPLENFPEDSIEFLFTEVDALPEAWLEGQETREQIWEALGKLPPEQRAVIVLRYFLDTSVDEISREMISPSGTIKWRLHKARERLRQLLTPLERNENKQAKALEAPSGDPEKTSGNRQS